jgi:2-hydroxy-6-oxonona-2,4-dienedioate hydrolase
MAAMRRRAASVALAVTAALLTLAAAAAIHAHFARDLAQAHERAAHGAQLVPTRCGPIEVQQAGEGVPMLVVHGSGGGHDQGMDFARALTAHGIRVIAPSRFGYLRTPRPADASPAAQADAHACLLDALGVGRAAVLGLSAGAPSALQMALRHERRVSALVLVVPIVHTPSRMPSVPAAVADDDLLLHVLGSDALFWSALHVSRDAVLRWVLGTPPALLATASAEERARVRALADRVLPVSARAAGLRDDTGLGRRLGAEPLETLRVPTLVIAARDDGFGTFEGARHAAERIAGARFVGFEHGGHLLVGHDAQVRAEILALVAAAGRGP